MTELSAAPDQGSDAAAQVQADRAPIEADDAVFLQRYLAHAPSQLPGRQQSVLADIAKQHFELGRRRAGDQILISVRDVDGGTSAIDIVTADAPYLVDSTGAELGRTGHPVVYLLHPQIVVRRNADGDLCQVLNLEDTAEVPAGAATESWMHIETPVIPADERASVAADLRRVLVDVHHAVADAPELYRLIRDLADELSAHPGQFDRDTSAEAAALLRWLADGNFMILGHAAYSANELASPVRRGDAEAGTPRGVLRGEASISPLELLPAYRSGAPLVIFKSPMVSTVRRSARYDCVTVIAPGENGSGEKIHVFLGLITDETDGTVGRVPVLRRRIAEVLQRSGARADSHTGRQLLAALRTLPRDELLEATSPDLLRLATLVVDRADRGGIGVFARTHLNRDFVSVLVYFPADRLGPETRRRVRDVILLNWPGRIIARDDRIVELGLARMHFLIALRPGEEVPNPERSKVEATVAQVTRRWSDDLADLLTVGVGEQEADRMLRKYSNAFPEAYKEDFPASVAVSDLRRLESLPDHDGLAFELYTPPTDDAADRRLKVFRTGLPLSLGRTLPMLELMGIEVLDERPYELEPADGTASWIYDFGLRIGEGVDFSQQRSAAVIDTLRVLWAGGIEQDGFNALVVRAGLTWQQTVVLRAYAKYLRQAGSTFSQGYIELALSQNPTIARLLVDYFETRFDPARQPSEDAQAEVRQRIDEALAGVASLDQDRILRSFLGLVAATLRTNFYRTYSDDAAEPGPTAGAGAAVSASVSRPEAFAVKLDSREVPDLPEPRPRFEIWVYSPRVEGVHLRFGAVARGGLRWSDRREDFRTEVLGLVKAQMVKNTVIVPVGSKGGFVAKRLPDPAADRDAWLAEGIACYRLFITSLLELTDNYRTSPDGSRTVVAPPSTVRYDGDDPYLVVAADKGTATFSDIANAIAVERGFWLGDAFASGGSVGYDHKAMGITAKGAWESVKYHFRELGLDTQTQDFTVVGVGDMSGDVFGNGMLLSDRIRLLAAFDHRHIFLDPDPDAARSFAERARMFALPRSSWADYDASLLSEGGGVFPRSLKAIPVSAQVAAALGLPEGTAKLPPAVLINAILRAPVDLLWNGGIGTYVKASTETHLDAGDKANDPLRADGAQLRCRVVGEGGNLGFTQRGRVEFARAGGRINTDAIDNSAGVDTSDHEVNIKILLDREVQAGVINTEERNQLLGQQTDEVARLVLADNYGQNVLLGVARHGARALVSVHRRLIRELEKAGELDRTIEFLPSDKELAAREAAREGLSSPELAVLAAYVKIVLSEQIRESSLPDEPWFQRALSDYFPHPVAERFRANLSEHPLQREIITTCVVNDLVNRGGSTFVFRAMEETGVDPAQVTRAYTVVREVFSLSEIWAEIEALDNQVPTTAQHIGYREVRRTIDRAVRWLVDVRFPISDAAGEIERFGPTVADLSPRVPDLLRGRERDNLYSEVERLVGHGLPRSLAMRISCLLTSFLLLDVVEISVAENRPPAEVADLHFALSERLSVDDILYAVTSLPRDDRWSALARAAMRHDVYAALAAITTSVLRATDATMPAGERIEAWAARNPERVERARATFAEALSRDPVDLATLSVALRVMRSLPTS
ncbi:NAD-glutamate dehydrogenase [Jatrophihabitans telluris]|uniref:NAD-glutamate dehydrogenase n=1 Tax=Jatrophihabitans telluris TaxID=2038343 RepID=A0ABY4QZZ8_9ACTN|nr:NAD-glutamate dehydrogenase [Jatrophihabitans telluris]UQX88596.1 NAD-glutamate dehydrogenase [Jatrophihabitans telluris]